MHEMSILKDEFESFQGRLCVLSDKIDTKAYVRSIYQIPDNIEFYCDENFEKLNIVLKYIKENKQPILPFVCIIDKANNVTYVSSGYKPERGNEILMKTRRYYE